MRKFSPITFILLLAVCSALLAQSQTPAPVPPSLSAVENHINPVGLMRLHLAWGWGKDAAWNGTVALSEGTIASPVPLGTALETPGTFCVENGELRFRQSEPGRSHGFQWTVYAPITASIRIRLNNSTTGESYEKEIPLMELVTATFAQAVDSQGNRLILRRAYGDELAVVPKHGSLVFGPSETLYLDLYPRFLSVKFDPGQLVELSLVHARTKEKIPYTEQNVSIAANSRDFRTPISVRLPHASGVYDLVLTLKQASEDNAQGIKLAERTVQVVVVDSVNHWAASLRETGNLSTLKTEQEFVLNPSDPHWRQSLEKSFPAFPEAVKRSGITESSHSYWTCGGVSARHTPVGTLMTLPVASPGDDSAWAMYPLPIRHVNQPHVLEVEYLSTDSQSLGISILEHAKKSNLPGELELISLDSGVDRVEEVAGETVPQRILTHRIVFWPKTEMPVVLLSNRQQRRAASFGKIRLSRVIGPFPKAFTENSGRLFAAYLHRPTFVENFGASCTGATDWVSFFDGVNRLSDYLQSVGYNGAMISVSADGSTIYPGETAVPTPRFDSGVFLSEGEDPIRKDVVELLVRVFDREKLTLIPAVDFNAPIPRLEERIRREIQSRSESGNTADALSQFATERGYYWVDPNGKTITQVYGTTARCAPHYNMLHPVVQEEMINSILEILVRYGNHSSFGGIAVQLSVDGFAQLPDEFWGMDDFTIAQFQEETQTAIPVGPAENRFARRYDYIRTHCMENWIRWRAKKVALFYAKMSQMIVHFRPDAKLYLSSTALLDGEKAQNAFYPTLSRKPDIAQTLLVLGFDLDALNKERSLVFLRPWKTSFSGQPQAISAQSEMEQAELFAPLYRSESGSGAVFYNHNPALRIPSLEQKSPLPQAKNSFTFQAVPSDRQNRKRFLRELAKTDVHTYFDGGQFLSLGQEDSLADFLAVFRRLPAVPFQTYTPKRPLENAAYTARNATVYGTIRLTAANGSPQTGRENSALTPSSQTSIQPLVVRYAHTPEETIVYLVNSAAFPVEAQITFTADAGTSLTELTGQREIPAPAVLSGGHLTWTVTVKPYDLLAIRLSDPASVPVDVVVEYPDEICGPHGKLRQVFDMLIHALDHPVSWDGLENPDFEVSPIGSSTDIPGWTKVGEETCTAKPDFEHTKSGRGSVQMSASDKVNIRTAGGMMSNTFRSPQTGRLFVHLWVGLEEKSGEKTGRCPLRLALTGRDRNSQTPFLRTVPLEQMVLRTAENVPPTDGVRWCPMTVPLTQLPFDSLENLAIRLDLTAEGTVWIDDIRMDSVAFTEAERIELLKMISVASYLPTNNRVSDSVELLEGFWSQLLLENNIAYETTLASSARLAAPRSLYAAEYRDHSAQSDKKIEIPKKTTAKTENSPSFFSRFKFW